MNFEILKITGQIAGIGGLAFGALILVFRDVIAKNIFPNLAKHQAYSLLRLVVILVWSVAMAGIAAWTYVTVNAQWIPETELINDQVTISPEESGQKLVAVWVAAAEEAREKETIHHSRPLPTGLLAARTAFERWWVDSNFQNKKGLEPQTLYKGLKYTASTYRVQELQSETKPSANHWADEAINFFEQTQNPYFLVESLLDKAAIFLELSQIEHTEPEEFRRLALEGDSVMARAASLAKDQQKSNAYRIWSRFYYNLARPLSGNLEDNWDNNYLLSSYNKMQAAFDLQPEAMKNVTQLARITHRTAMYPPQDSDPKWTRNLRRVQQLLKHSWEKNEKKLKTPARRIPPLNILGNITMQTVHREWESAHDAELVSKAAIDELTEVALPALREVVALVRHTEWEEDYDFDLNYDLGRINSVISIILIAMKSERADQHFQEVLRNMRAARIGGSAIQNDAAFLSIDSDPNLANLPEAKREQLRKVFRPEA